MNLLVDAGDSVNQAQQQIMFLNSMFTAASAHELEFSEFGLCGLTQNLRGILDLLEIANNALSQLIYQKKKEMSGQI